MALQNDLWVATSLLTRLPIRLRDDAYTRAADAAWAYPLIGAMTGLITALVALVAMGMGLSSTMAAVLALAASMIATGAMHEDGLADCADGFWGGWDPEMRLKIMKDSNIGTYGVLALLTGFAIRVLGYSAIFASGISSWGMILTVIGVHMASRAVMPVVMASLPHARSDGLSRSVGQVTSDAALKAGAIGAVALWIGAGFGAAFLGAIVLSGVVLAGRKIAMAKIGGQTGDVIGAHQQLAEMALLLMLVASI